MKNFLRVAALAICAILMTANASAQDNYNATTMGEKVYLETANWGQNSPFNKQIFTSYGGSTNAKAGCVPTAYAIVMRYHEFPTEGTSKTLYNCQASTYVEITDRVYDFSKMPLTNGSGWTEEQQTEVSKFFSHVLHACFPSSIGTGATTVNEGQTSKVLNDYFNYQLINASYQANFTMEQWAEKLRESISNGCPVPYAANNSGTGDSRHMFVVDGYTTGGYFHFNFGWSGSGNGWFKLDDITPAQGDDYSWKQDSEHYANFNLKPDVPEEEEKEEETQISTTDYFVKPSSGLDYGRLRFSVWQSVPTAEFPAVLKIAVTDSNGNMVNTISQYDDSHKFYTQGFIDGTETMASAPITYTLSVSEGYFITGYCLTYYPSVGGKVTVENEYGYSETPASTKVDYVMSASDLHTNSTTFSVTGTSASYAITTVNFTVTVGSEINTGIEEIEIGSTVDANQNGKAKVIYDLLGRKVDTPNKGIYIIDGKKVLVK